MRVFELSPLSSDDVQAMFDLYLQFYKRQLTIQQRQLLAQYINAMPHALYAKLVSH